LKLRITFILITIILLYTKTALGNNESMKTHLKYISNFKAPLIEKVAHLVIYFCELL